MAWKLNTFINETDGGKETSRLLIRAAAADEAEECDKRGGGDEHVTEPVERAVMFSVRSRHDVVDLRVHA